MNAFDWFDSIISVVKTPNYIKPNPLSSEALESFKQAHPDAPHDFFLFLVRYGECHMCPIEEEFWYTTRVFLPRQPKKPHPKNFFEIAYNLEAGTLVYFPEKKNLAFTSSGKRFVAVESFEAFLRTSIEDFIKSIEPERWQPILNGPAPFSKEEEDIVKAVPFFVVKILNTAPAKMVLKVSNNSKTTLNYLTIGVKVPGRMQTTVALNVSALGPGDTNDFEVDLAYTGINVTNAHLYQLPLPGIEDRKRYFEFKLPDPK